MKRILLIQSRQNQNAVAAEQEQFRKVIGREAQVSFLSVLDEKLAWNTPAELLKGYGGVMFGGSGDFDLHGGREKSDPLRIMAMLIVSRLRNLVSYALTKDKPTFGICFGHQLIAEMHGGKVLSDPEQKKVGTYEVALTDAGKADSLFKSMPHGFSAQYAHRDAVTSLPEGATLLAVGPACKFSALRYGQHVYSTQFHPELSAEDSIARLKSNNGYLPEGVAAESLVRPSVDASTLIPAWVAQIPPSAAIHA